MNVVPIRPYSASTRDFCQRTNLEEATANTVIKLFGGPINNSEVLIERGGQRSRYLHCIEVGDTSGNRHDRNHVVT